MSKIRINEWLNEGCGSFVINESMLVKEHFVRELIDNSTDIILKEESDELLLNLEGKGIYTIVSYL